MNSQLSEPSSKGTTSDERIGRLYMLLAMSISGTIGYFVLLSGQRPFNVVFFRCTIGSIGLSAYCLSRGYFRSFRITARNFVNLFLGAVTLIANWCFLFTAYRLTSVGITTVVYNVQPFLLLIAGFLVRRERPSRAAIVWLMLAFAGLVVLAQPGAQQHDRTYMMGILCALMAAMLYATTTLLTRSLSQTLRPELIAVGHMAIGALVFVPLADFGQFPNSVAQVSAILILGVIHTTLMYILLYGAFQKAATGSLAVLGFVYPLVAVAVDFAGFGKVLTLAQVAGGALIVASAAAYAAGLDPFSIRRAARNAT
ncbi:DMT family transporter [Paraburkholderia sp. SIMBA_055]|jgi:drug/metabolite transporter (DMT)-like permease